MNTLVNRFKIECTFQSLTTAYMDFLSNFSSPSNLISHMDIPSSLIAHDESDDKKFIEHELSYEPKYNNRKSLGTSKNFHFSYTIDQNDKKFLDTKQQDDIGAVNIKFAMFGNFLIKIAEEGYHIQGDNNVLEKDTFYNDFKRSYTKEGQEEDKVGSYDTVDRMTTESSRERNENINKLIESHQESDSEDSGTESYAGERDFKESMKSPLKEHYGSLLKRDRRADSNDFEERLKMQIRRSSDDSHSESSDSLTESFETRLTQIEPSRAMLSGDTPGLSRRTHANPQYYSTGIVKPEDDDRKLRKVINYLTQIAMSQKRFKVNTSQDFDDYVMIHFDGRKGIVNNNATLNVVDFLNYITMKSPVLDYGQIRAQKLPQIKDFKYRTSSK